MTQGQKLAAGLALIADIVVGASFYNSSGGDAVFDLARPLSKEELAALKRLDFWNYSEYMTSPEGGGPATERQIDICFRSFP